MNEWCINQHGKTGLTQACIDSPHTHEEVEEKVRAYLEKWIPEAGAGLLAGSSVHADMRYVHLPMRLLSSSFLSTILTFSSILLMTLYHYICSPRSPRFQLVVVSSRSDPVFCIEG